MERVRAYLSAERRVTRLDLLLYSVILILQTIVLTVGYFQITG